VAVGNLTQGCENGVVPNKHVYFQQVTVVI
jgi:hypothetical protein